MSRGKKLNLFVGAQIDDDWAEIKEVQKKSSSEILDKEKHQLFFKKEKRRGKTVTLVGEFHMPQNEAQSVLKTIKKKLGCGGSYKENWMEFQGEVKEKLRDLLDKEGFRFKHGH